MDGISIARRRTVSVGRVSNAFQIAAADIVAARRIAISCIDLSNATAQGEVSYEADCDVLQ